MTMAIEKQASKSEVKKHWEKETCGTRYSVSEVRSEYSDQISKTRYELEPYIIEFAEFQKAEGKRVLEIGVGAGSDFLNWVRYAAEAKGIDLTVSAIKLTKERLDLNNIPPSRYSLTVGDAEMLQYEDDYFEIVYSWGVLHHTPDTERALSEAFRVLKRGGELKVMVYHVQSWTALMLWIFHGLFKGRFNYSLKDAIYYHLESPGTKTYKKEEIREILTKIGFTNVELETKLNPGDLLTIRPSDKYDRLFYKIIWKLYPRWLVLWCGNKYGLNMLVKAKK